MNRPRRSQRESRPAQLAAHPVRLPRSLWWRVPLACAAVLGGLVVAGDEVVRAALPAVAWAVSTLAPEFEVMSLALERNASDRVVMLKVSVEGTIVLGGQVLQPAPGSVAQASTLALQCLHGPALAACVALAWPAGGPGTAASKHRVHSLFESLPNYFVRGLLVCALSAALLLLDLPVVLAGAAWQSLVDTVAPGQTSALLSWKAFIGQGGRLALGLVAGVAAVMAAGVVGRARRE